MASVMISVFLWVIPDFDEPGENTLLFVCNGLVEGFLNLGLDQIVF